MSTQPEPITDENVAARLKARGLSLPAPAKPAGSYVPYVISGAHVYISGQLPFQDGKVVYSGKVGGNLSVAEGQRAAEICALNLLAQVREACGGSFARVRRCVSLRGFVNATPDFKDHPVVINGASDLLAAVFGEAGRHARAAVGAGSLPLDVAVELEAVFEIAEAGAD